MILKVNSANPQERYLKTIVECLEKGEVIAYPTDTNYGFGCSIFEKKAIEKLRLLTARDKKKPFSFICNGLSDISKYAKVSNSAYRTMKRLLPGPYTFILPSTSLVPRIMMTKQRTVGIRVPDCNIALSIVEKLGHPIVNTTAAVPSEQAFSDPLDIHASLKKLVGIVVDGGRLVSDPSTIIDLTDDSEPVVVRKGKGSVDIF